MENILIGFYICIAFQVAILGIINLFQHKKRNKILGVFCFLILFSLLKRAFWESIDGSALYCLLGGPHDMLYAPLLYTYLLTGQEKLKKNYLNHIFLAFGVYLILHFSGLLFFRDSRTDILPFYLVTIIVFSVVYFFKGILLFKNLLKEKLRPYPRLRFQFFYISVNAYILFKALIIFIVLINDILDNPILNDLYLKFSVPAYDYIIVPLFIILSFIYIFYAFTEINWFKRTFLNIDIHKQQRKITVDYVTIKKLLNVDRVYIDPNLTLDSFTHNYQINRSMVRQFIKDQGFDKFQDLINNYRINDFKNRIKNEDISKFDLFSIAQESGFKSKATFYRVFKKNENITPGEYLQQIS
ncbi:AraC family transcriptional regulator [Aquimarina sp. 2201CG5-10]|uniref:AraC family transcriptional regulator n=1 Tax=Aquimarina callyspongiae TaxID=3098150 RepID=UPI002AB3D864|nr:AraC family transcriptional regulator [Aquimarina sp. 2201CG5-10]MDY8135145.1 AraC family transcriptional regulator [Aquimarina sp. 2201CG5-10]